MSPEDRLMTLDDQESKETRALLALIALGELEIAAGRTRPLGDVVARLRAKNKTI